MATSLPTPTESTPGSSSGFQRSKPQRVLACVLCQQRKVRCDRKFPCANCIKSRTQCVPATLLPRRKRRRVPERELLERIRKYEELLRRNNVGFEPLRSSDLAGAKAFPTEDGDNGSDCERQERGDADWPSPLSAVDSERTYRHKDLWHAMSKSFQDVNDNDSCYDNEQKSTIQTAWDQIFGENDHLLLGSRSSSVDLSTLHPEPVQIFKLWQIYLENVNPLFKVTHTPSLQGRIIDAASDVNSIKPALEALVFSIYSMSVLSLDEEECFTMFSLCKGDLLTKYQFGCQQSLLNAGFLRSGDRECLTALFLYLVSVGPITVPRSLSSMLGVAIRIAQHIGIHSELSNAKCTALEAEMRRRLWWALVLFDTRIGEMSDLKTAATLGPTWDCKVPLNVNDSDLRPEMKDAPAGQTNPTEAIFPVVRGELGDFIRRTRLYFERSGLSSVFLAKDLQNALLSEGGQVTTMEKNIEDKHLRFCDMDNPIHFMTVWTTRAYIAKCRLVEYYSSSAVELEQPTETQYDGAWPHALAMLECDTQIMASPLTKRYRWHATFYFPFPAYVHIFHGLRRLPAGAEADRAWETMSDHYEARFGVVHKDGPICNDDSPFFKIFTKFVLQAWKAREAVFRDSGEPLIPPRIVAYIQGREMDRDAQSASIEQPDFGMGSGTDVYSMQIPMGFDYGMAGQSGFAGAAQGGFAGTAGQVPKHADINHLDWATIEWAL